MTVSYATSKQQQQQQQKKTCSLVVKVIFLLLVCGPLYLAISLSSTTSLKDTNAGHSASTHLKKFQAVLPHMIGDTNTIAEEDNTIAEEDNHGLLRASKDGIDESYSKAKLECDIGQEMVYWYDWPKSYRFKSPWDYNGQEMYVLFEYDHGGWNNIRMALEIQIVFAYVTNRTLVLPMDKKLYRLDSSKSSHESGVDDFFELKRLQEKMKVITMDEFIEKEILSKNLTPDVPNNIEDFKPEQFNFWLRKHTHILKHSCSSGNIMVLTDRKSGVLTEADLTPEYKQRKHKFRPDKIPVYYDEALQNQKYINFIVDTKSKMRWLNHFYSYFFFEKVEMLHHVSRFMRDYFHYRHDIWCKAAKIVQAIDVERKSLPLYGMHVRRGDFQFKNVKIDPAEIMTVMDTNLKNGNAPIIPHGSYIFIATDEHSKDWFKPFLTNYTIRFLDDFEVQADLNNIDAKYYGMLDTIVTSMSTTFMGTYYSTFSGFIMRLRAYRGQEYAMTNYYYPGKWYDDMIKLEINGDKDPAGWWRESPISWKDIDNDIVKLN